MIQRNGFHIEATMHIIGQGWTSLQFTVGKYHLHQVQSSVHWAVVCGPGTIVSAERLKSPKDWSPKEPRLPKGWTLLCDVRSDAAYEIHIHKKEETGHTLLGTSYATCPLYFVRT